MISYNDNKLESNAVDGGLQLLSCNSLSTKKHEPRNVRRYERSLSRTKWTSKANEQHECVSKTVSYQRNKAVQCCSRRRDSLVAPPSRWLLQVSNEQLTEPG